MLFSIIVPVYNVEKYLPQCLNSIMRQCQDVQDTEIILVDDGSTDESGNICDAYSHAYKNVTVYHNSNHGLLYTRRFGYAKAEGDYIINCDSDDYLQPDMLLLLRDAIEKMPADIYLFNMNTDKSGQIEVMKEHIFTKQNQMMFRLDMQSVRARFVATTDIVSLCAKVCRKTCINAERDYSAYAGISNGEDTLQSIEIYTNAQSAVYIDKALYNYRLGTGMTNQFDENYFHSFETTFNLMKQANEQWKLENIDLLIAERLFTTLGRAITQIRYAEELRYTLVRCFCKNLCKNISLREYLPMYRVVRTKLSPRYYQLLIDLFLIGRYGMITVLLKLKNSTEQHG